MSSNRITQQDRKNIKSLRKATRALYSPDSGDAGVFVLRESNKNYGSIKHSVKAGR